MAVIDKPEAKSPSQYAIRKAAIDAYLIKYYEENSEEIDQNYILLLERIAATRKNQRLKRKDKKMEYDHVYRMQNKDEKDAYQREYNKTMVGKLVVSRASLRRRDAVKTTVCDLTVEQWEGILSKQNYCCNHCGCEFTIVNPANKDHILPLSKGGGLTFDNIQALCRSCNARKCNKLESELTYLNKSKSD